MASIDLKYNSSVRKILEKSLARLDCNVLRRVYSCARIAAAGVTRSGRLIRRSEAKAMLSYL